ncbi:MAG: histidine phosphatase family protein [Acidimicrobiia bacterium]|nr:histidine phosphatase family protein [Acidimicrobiia bacterium]
MTRTLLLLRHAKSDWGDPDVADHDRPLNARGRRACTVVRDHLTSSDPEPSLVLCSTSTRTRETLGGILTAWSGAQTIRFLPGLYGADATGILHALHRVDADMASVLVVAHNPGIGDLAAGLAGVTSGEAGARIAAKFPTAALAVFETEVPWESLRAGTATLVDFFTPRESGLG